MTPTFLPRWFTKAEADALFLSINALPGWERRADAPRGEFYCNDLGHPYVYGRGVGRRIYHPQPWPEAVTVIRERVSAHLGVPFEVVFLNRYVGASDALGWHADNSPEMDDARPIAVVSLGEARDIQVRPLHGDKRPIQVFRLTNGSLFVMPPGMQDTHEHQIPKAGNACGTRISLTFRGWAPGACAPTP